MVLLLLLLLSGEVGKEVRQLGGEVPCGGLHQGGGEDVVEAAQDDVLPLVDGTADLWKRKFANDKIKTMNVNFREYNTNCWRVPYHVFDGRDVRSQFESGRQLRSLGQQGIVQGAVEVSLVGHHSNDRRNSLFPPAALRDVQLAEEGVQLLAQPTKLVQGAPIGEDDLLEPEVLRRKTEGKLLLNLARQLSPGGFPPCGEHFGYFGREASGDDDFL